MLFRTLLNIIVVLFFAITLYFSPKPLTKTINFFENAAYDLQLKHDFQPIPKNLPIAIVDADDKSIQSLGRWPWSRKTVASILDKLFEEGASLVAFDVLFSEQESSSMDQLLADAIGKGSSVLGYVFVKNGQQVGELPTPLIKIPRNLSILEAEGYTANLPLLQSRAKSAGFINATPDSDGVMRYSPMIISFDDSIYSSLSLESVKTILGIDQIEFKTAKYGDEEVLEGIQLGNQLIPTDPLGRVLIPFHGPPYTFQYYSASDILSGTVGKAELANKLIFFGSSASALGDVVATPASPSFPKIEIHANIAASILDGFFPIRPTWGRGFEISHILIVGLICAFLLPHMGPVTATIFAPAVTILLIAANRWIWLKYQLYLPILFPLFALYAQFLVSLITGLSSYKKQQ